MKRTAFFTILFLLFFACDNANGMTGPGGDRRYSDPEREYWCNLAEDMMHHPAAYDPQVPSEATRKGRKLYNDWRCSQPGEIQSNVQRGDTL